MSGDFWSAAKSRGIRTRIVVEGDLVLQTPACLSNGDTDDVMDMPLLVDPYDGITPLLTGTSLAGALRAYLAARELGYNGLQLRNSATVALFGGTRTDDEGEQSALVVEDSLGRTPSVESRTGVRISPKSRTAEDKALYNLELWSAGTLFPVHLELVITDINDDTQLRQALATALEGLSSGEITLGMRKHRGLGCVKVSSWRVREYNISNCNDLLAWLCAGAKELPRDIDPRLQNDPVRRGSNLAQLLNTSLLVDIRQYLHIEADFDLDGSLVVGGSGANDEAPDKAHTLSRRSGRSVPVLPGTSLAGALRARARRIAHLLAGNSMNKQAQAQQLIEDLFGSEKIQSREPPKASRLRVTEHAITEGRSDLVHYRVRIDRFTGGSYPSALFNVQPVYGVSDTRVKVELLLRNPELHEVGLLLLLLKDLWTGDLPVGGELGVGRGRLRGRNAQLRLTGPGGGEWALNAGDNGNLVFTHGNHREELENYVGRLASWLEHHPGENENG